MISINIFEIIMQMVNFIILVWLLQRFLFKPLGAFLEKRAGSIEQDIAAAKADHQEATAVLNQQKQVLKEAAIEAQQVRAQAEESAKKERENVLNQAKAESEKVATAAQKEIELEQRKAKKELLDEIGSISLKISEKIIEKELNAANQAELIEQYLTKVGDQ